MTVFVITVTVLVFAAYQFLISVVNILWRENLPLPRKSLPTATVSVLIPARNEAANLPLLLADLLKQSYPPAEIIVCDDHSSDGTAQVVAAMANSSRQTSVFRSAPLPGGWTGKNFACCQLASKATGDYMLFIDADVRLGTNAVQRALTLASDKRLGLLSVFPKQTMLTPGEKSAVPLMNFILLTLLPLALVGRSPAFPSISAANGQFMLFGSRTYKNLSPHYQVRGEKVEDIAIAHLLKQNRIKTVVITGDEDISCRMYTGLNEAINGFAKNINAFFFNSYVLAAMFWLITTFGFIPVFINCPLSLSVAYIVILAVTRVSVSLASRQPVTDNILYWAIQQITLGRIILRSVYGRIKKNQQWKGRYV